MKVIPRTGGWRSQSKMERNTQKKIPKKISGFFLGFFSGFFSWIFFQIFFFDCERQPPVLGITFVYHFEFLKAYFTMVLVLRQFTSFHVIFGQFVCPPKSRRRRLLRSKRSRRRRLFCEYFHKAKSGTTFYLFLYLSGNTFTLFHCSTSLGC